MVPKPVDWQARCEKAGYDRQSRRDHRQPPAAWRLATEMRWVPQLLFTEKETNDRRIFGTANRTAFVKDGINDFLLHGRTAAVNPAKTGTNTAAYYLLDIPAAGSATVRLRLRRAGLDDPAFDASFDEIFARRHAEADAFYDVIISMSRAGWRSTMPFHCPEASSRSAMPTGFIWSTTTSSRCRTSGSIPGTPAGT
jgi:hypothetical protein